MRHDEKTTSPSSVRALIEEALASVVSALDGLPSTATTRELRGKAESFKRILDMWDASGPRGLQLETVGKGVSDLHERTMEVVAEARRKNSAPA